jgi:MoxR-like ATPase
MLDIVDKTRSESRFITGVSTRGAIALYKASQVEAAFSGRDYVLPEDVRFVAPHVLCHRLSTGGLTKSLSTRRPSRWRRYNAHLHRCSDSGGGGH